MTANDQPAVVPAPVVDEVLDAVPARPPRTRPVRFVLALLPFAVYVAPLWVASDLASQRPGSSASNWALGALRLLRPVVMLWFTAPLVSYRRRDALCGLIPFYSLWFGARIAWRLAYLPYRDWLPRPDEHPHWRLVEHPARPGQLAHLDDRRQ
ncbi:hypothetical protein [Luedemannella helvata]|uniref:Uncharacterized protein n=1 Tax=Luedemannella helvata TaxID=349315 RepID=A0ABP4W6R1_9ACTN